jgi:hypothetical protein
LLIVYNKPALTIKNVEHVVDVLLELGAFRSMASI